MGSPSIASAAGSHWLEAIVVHKEEVAENVQRFELRPPPGTSFPPFSAGAHIDVRLPNGAVRQYSLCNDPHEIDRYEIGVLLDPAGRGGSRSAHEDVRQGDTLAISAPRNLFPLHPAEFSVLIAGGIGVTPLLSMAEQLNHAGADFELHYCARSRTRLAFRERMMASAFSKRVHTHVDDGDEGQKFNAREMLSFPRDDVHLYVCGPQGFMDYVIQSAKSLGWNGSNIHFEYFSAAPQSRTGEIGFEVELAGTGQVVPVLPDQTVAQALRAHGISIPLSCEQGICGTCVMQVIDGIPDHRDVFFNDQEKAANDRFTPCCSRAKSPRLVIDF